jgi:hypothetical protein
MRFIAIVAAAAAFAMPVLAVDDSTAADEAAHAALADRAEPFAMPPTLPDSASARAKDVAFGQQGARKKADAAGKAHGAAEEAGREAASEAGSDAANRAAHGAAASAAGAANADSHNAAGQARAAAVRNGGPSKTPGSGRGH